MFITELFNGAPVVASDQPTKMYVEDSAPQLVVTYPGRFQPFHLGHRDVFAALQGKFGRDHVWIATSNKTELPKSPFNFTDKVTFMTASGIPVDRILEVTSPYKLPTQFEPTETIFLVTVGAPDADRLRPGSYRKDGQPGYYQKFESIDKCDTADKHAYVIVAAERKKVITIGGKQYDVSHGTESRALWQKVRKNGKQRAEYITQMFGQNEADIGHILDKIEEDSNMPVAVDSASAIPGTVYEGLNESSDEFVIFVNGKPAAKYADLGQAESVVMSLKSKFPSTDIRIKHEVCKMEPVSEDAAGVGVVSNSKDPRYVMATMGDQNDVTAETLPKEMQAYGLTGRKSPAHKAKK